MVWHNPVVMDPENSPAAPQPGYGPLGGPVGNPDSLIELSRYAPSGLQSTRTTVERGITDGVLPRNIQGELDNPVVERAALLYLAKHDDVVLQREFEDRFTPLVIEAARGFRSEYEGAPDTNGGGEMLAIVRRVLTLLDGGVITAQEAEEGITWPSHLVDIERRATSRLLDPPSHDER